MEQQIITLDISDGMIRSNMKRKDVIDYLKKHSEIKCVKPKVSCNGFSNINLSFRNKTFTEKISVGFYKEDLISMDRSTHEYYLFRVIESQEAKHYM